MNSSRQPRHENITLFICLIAFCIHTGNAADSLGIDPPMRNAWSRGSTRFLRQWLLLGPVRSFSATVESARPVEEDLLVRSGGEPDAHPGPFLPARLPGGDSLRWTPVASYGDAVDICGGLATPAYRGSHATPEVAYAYATVKSEKPGAALLSVGVDGGSRIWVNGKLVHDQAAPTVFAFDEFRAQVQLIQGENRLLVKLVHRTGPWRLALRVLEPGTVVRRIDEIVPVIASGNPDELSVRTDLAKDPAGKLVAVQVLAPGGKVMARGMAARGESVKFAASEWPDGPYEVQCVTSTPWGKKFTCFLPWYKGDAGAAARRLIESAAGAKAGPEGETIRMLAEMVKERSGGDLKNLTDDGWHRIHSPLMEFEELQMAQTTPSAVVRPGGFVRMAYTDEVDGSTQFCRAYLPAEYDPSRTWPVVLFLHGYNPPNPPYVRWWSVDDRHNPVAEYHGAIYLEPHGRGNAQYIGIGERDVLRCIEEARRRFSVDNDRIYLTGESMGGSGTWIIASRHPDIFAAAAPFYGGWDYRIIPGSPYGGNPRADSPPERFAQEVQSSFLSAENLLNVPLFVHHGDADQAVSVEFSRHAVKMLQRWGYDIRYQELPGWGHEDLNMREDIADWLLSHRRLTAPRHVRIRAPDLSAASVNWVSVEGREDPFDLINVEAEMIRPGLVRLDTRNVTGVTLSPPEELRGKGDTLRVDWNGTTHSLILSAKGEVTLDVHSERTAPLTKRPGLDGGLSKIITTPFAVVVGTCSTDPLMRRRCSEKAEAFAALWTSWQHCRPRILRDSEITEAEERQYSLLLIGGADANLVTRRLDLPLRITREAITVDGRSVRASDAVVQMIYPSPFNRERYIEVVAGTSASGLYFWNPLHWEPNYGFPTLSWDWIIRDGRRTKLESGLGAQRGWVASGVFDRNWKRDDRLVFPGSEALRAGSPLRHAPGPGFEPDGKALDACVGSYEVFPGNYATVAREGNGLIVRVPYGPALELVAENDTEFVVKDRGTSVVFSRDPQGKVDGVTVNDDGQEMSAKKVR